jgi:hypothetical protein
MKSTKPARQRAIPDDTRDTSGVLQSLRSPIHRALEAGVSDPQSAVGLCTRASEFAKQGDEALVSDWHRR